MKIYFASLTNMLIEVDAWVPDETQGALLLTSLAHMHREHVAVMRARMKKGQDLEARFIGDCNSPECASFLLRVLHMNKQEDLWKRQQASAEEMSHGSSTEQTN